VKNCLALIHAVSQANCQKSYLLNTLVFQELIINSLHSRCTKIIIISTYIENLHSKSISLTNQVEKQASRSQQAAPFSVLEHLEHCSGTI
jgi:hypothetical protein